MISIGCLSNCNNENCLAEVSVTVECKVCGNSYCLECSEELIEECDVCHKNICKLCIATKEDADYTVCLCCLEQLLVTSENYSQIVAEVKKAIAISKCDSTKFPDDFQRHLYLARQIGKVRGLLIGLGYRFGFC